MVSTLARTFENLVLVSVSVWLLGRSEISAQIVSGVRYSYEFLTKWIAQKLPCPVAGPSERALKIRRINREKARLWNS